MKTVADSPSSASDREVAAEGEPEREQAQPDGDHGVDPTVDALPGSPPHAEYSTVHDPKCCQVCRQVFPTTREKGIHVTLAHDLGRSGKDHTLKFAACESCGRRTYTSLGICECGEPMKRSW